MSAREPLATPIAALDALAVPVSDALACVTEVAPGCDVSRKGWHVENLVLEHGGATPITGGPLSYAAASSKVKAVALLADGAVYGGARSIVGKDTQGRGKDKGGSQDSISTLSRLEWDRLLIARDADRNLETLAASGVLKATFPALCRLIGFGGGDSGHKDLWGHTKRVVIQTLPQPLLRWAALFHDCGKPLVFSRVSGEVTFYRHEQTSAGIFKKSARLSRLFEAGEITRVESIIRLLGLVEAYSAEWTDAAVRRLGSELGDLAEDVLAVARADCTTKSSARRGQVQRRCHELKTRLAKLKELDSVPSALPSGLGEAVMARLGFQDPMTREQALEMGRVWRGLKAMVEAGELPRSGDFAVYLERIKDLL